MQSSSDEQRDAARPQCVPCAAGIPALHGADLERRRARLSEQWRVIDEHHLERAYRFSTFKEALAFANRVGELAERLGHHPEILVGWGKVRLTLWTHKSHGLTDSDFELASHIDQLGGGADTPARSPLAPDVRETRTTQS